MSEYSKEWHPLNRHLAPSKLNWCSTRGHHRTFYGFAQFGSSPQTTNFPRDRHFYRG